MSAEQDQLPDEEAERGWKERVAAVADAWTALAQTRLAILREEIAEKRAFLLKGLIGVVLAAGLAAGALLLFAAFLAALLAHWFGNVALGILAALVLYGAGAAAAAVAGVKALTRVKPFEFPAASEELRRDWNAVQASWSADGEGEDDAPLPGPEATSARAREDSPESLEERYRSGAE